MPKSPINSVTPPPLTKFQAFGVAVVVGIGIALRLRHLLLNHSLWLDEASLALAVLSADFSELTQPLAFAQAAPIGFITLMKALTVLVDNTGESVLRTIPFLCGVLALPIFAACAVRLLPAWPAIAATLLFALSHSLIDYGTQVKPYAVDVLASVILIWLYLSVRENRSTIRLIGLVTLPCILIWLSFPSVFGLTAVGVALGLSALTARDYAALRLLVMAGGCWLASFAVQHHLVSSQLVERRDLLDYWANRHAAFAPLDLEMPIWFAAKMVELAALASAGPGFALVALAAAGFAVLCHTNWREAVLLSGPILVTVAVSAASLYPFAHRLIVFLTPHLLLLAGVAGVMLYHRCRGKWVWIPVAVLAVLTAHPFNWGRSLLMHPERFGREEFRDVYIAAHEKNLCNSKLVVFHHATRVFAYYDTYKTVVPPGSARAGDHENLASQFDEIRKCVWVVLSHFSHEDEAFVNAQAEAHNFERVEAIDRIGARAIFFERRASK